MSKRLVSGGTYHVQASEMTAHLQDRQPKTVQCVVHFLDDSEESFEVDVSRTVNPLTPPDCFSSTLNNEWKSPL